MSDADRIAMRYVAETTFGVTPSGPAPTMQDLRFTSESLAQNTETTKSAEIVSDRQAAHVIRTSLSAGGDINFELSYGSYDDFLAAALCDDAWSAAIVMDADSVDVVASTGTFTFGSENPSTEGLTAGNWVKTSGFSNAGNNGYFKLSSVTSTTIVVENKENLVDETGSGDEVVTQGGAIVNGTTGESFSIEKEFTDLSNEFAILVGMMVNTLNLNVQSNAIITGSFGLIGKTETSAAATAGDGSPTAVNTNTPLNAIDHVNSFKENAAEVGVTQFTLDLNNNLRNRLQIKSLGPISVGLGSIDLSGTLQLYFSSKTLFDKYLNFTTTSLGLVAVDADGNAYIIDVPSVKLTGGQRVAGGQNQDIIADFNWMGFKDATEGVTLRIVRFAA